MRLLYLTHHWTNNSHHSQYSGFQRIVAFAAKYHEVTLITWGSNSGDFVNTDGVHIIQLSARKRDLLFTKRLKISQKGRDIAGNFDVVHSLYSDCTYYLRPGTYIFTLHVLPKAVKYDSVYHKAFLVLKYFLLQKRAMKNASRFVTVSRSLTDYLPEKYKYKANFIAHGVDTEFWDPELVTEPCIVEGRYVLCIGAHGVDYQLLDLLITKNSDCTFVIVGFKRIFVSSNVLQRNGISDKELRNLYKHACCVIRPLKFATANNSILEALSMGKWVLVTRIKGVTDYVDDSTCKFIDELNEFRLNDFVYPEFRPDVRSRAVAHFSWELIFKEYMEIYKRLNH